MNIEQNRHCSGRLFAVSAVFILVWLSGAVAPAQILTNTWTGGSSTNWSDAGNWDAGVVPATNHVVRLGAAEDGGGNPIDNAVQNIDLDIAGVETWSLLLACEGDREVTLTSSIGASLTLLKTGGIHTTVLVHMPDTATAPATLDVRMEIVMGSWSVLQNDSLNAVLTVGPNEGLFDNGTGTAWRSGQGTVRLHDVSGSFRFGTYPDTSIVGITILDMAGKTMRSWSPYAGADIRLASDFYSSRSIQAQNAGTSTLSIVESGPDDRMFRFGYSVQGGVDHVVKVVDSPDGSTGSLTISIGDVVGWAFYRNSSKIVTRAGDTVEFFRDRDAAVGWAPHGCLGGEGNMRLAFSSSANRLTNECAWTYTGRTILQGGTLVLGEYDDGGTVHYGALPPATIVEISGNATLDINGINALVGGLSDYEGTAGSILLNSATLTVNSEADSVFGGVIVGAGGLVKTGAESLSLTAGYTNSIGRILRAEGGLLGITGELDVVEGDFYLAGGKVAAGTLHAPGATWNVVLGDFYEDTILVDVAGEADITGALLELSLAPDYQPETGRSYTLLRADNITGVSPGGNLFQYQEGRAFKIDDYWFRIRLESGSANIVLTAIPEIVQGTIIMVQ